MRKICRYIEKNTSQNEVFFYGAPCRIRIHALLVRSQTLYPAELTAHIFSTLLVYHSRKIKSSLFFKKN